MTRFRTPARPRPHLLARTLALGLAASLSAHAQDPQRQHGHQDQPVDLDAVEVRATPLSDTAEGLAIPVEILTGKRLDEAKAATLGDTVGKLPGVQSASFGAGVGRPIIRGLDGARVRVLSDGLDSGDVSTVSVDHAVSIEPFLADQIEVLKGPATLLYGSGAIGGAVNVVDGRIPETLAAVPFEGRAELRGASGNHERTGMLRLDGNAARFAFHFDALHREAGDYAIPGVAQSAAHLAESGESAEDAEAGRLGNSALATDSAALGLSWIGERGFIGASYSLYNSRYGIPGGAHAHDDDGGDPDHHAHDHDHDHDHAHDGGDDVRIVMDQRRSELRGGLDAFGPFRSLRVKFANTDYTHTEFEGDAVGTLFDNRARELRAELVHAPLAGWEGAIGLQAGNRAFAAVGAEAFVPSSSSRDSSLFWIGKREFGALQLDLGARQERNRIDVDQASTQRADRSFDASSVSANLGWTISPAWHASLGVDRAQRAPSAEELYSSGLHVATGSHEFGDADLRVETAQRIELGMHLHHGPLEAQLSLWQARYDDFIYLAGTDADLDGSAVRLWRQADARFHGAEAKLDWEIADRPSGLWTLGLFGDIVRARLAAPAGTVVVQDLELAHDGHIDLLQVQVAAGGYLPRIAPARIGASLRWERDDWRASLGAVHSLRQDRVAAYEAVSAGYTLVDAHLAWHRDGANGLAWELFLDASNLTDREARPHTSFLKELVPLPGRSLAFGVRAFF